MRPTTRWSTVVGTSVLVLATSACGADTSGNGDALSANGFRAATARAKAAGKPAYFLGTQFDDLPLTALDLVEENAPAFQVEADYGSCTRGDGGCSDPVVVSTNDQRPDVQGTTCQRLEPQLGVPAGVLMGELTLVTGDVIVTASDFRGRDSTDIRSALRLLTQLRAVGASRPVGTLPAPSPSLAAWMDEICGRTPGREVSHPLAADPLDNSHVPDFTVERLGGGELSWADYRGKPLVIAVGSVAQVSAMVRRLQPLLAPVASHPALLGLVTDLTADKFNPRPIGDIEREAGRLPVPVGYAAVPLSAMWFLDAAESTGVPSAMDTGVVAFVDPRGAVVRFAPTTMPPAQLEEWARALG